MAEARIDRCLPTVLRTNQTMPDIIYKDEAYKIVGACFEAYNEKGCGFLEPVYQECLEIEFELQGIPSAAQKLLSLSYKGRSLRQKYGPDFICYDKIIVEIKAVSALVDEHRAQVLNFLNATGYQTGPFDKLRPLSQARMGANCQYKNLSEVGTRLAI